MNTLKKQFTKTDTRRNKIRIALYLMNYQMCIRKEKEPCYKENFRYKSFTDWIYQKLVEIIPIFHKGFQEIKKKGKLALVLFMEPT